MVIAFILQWLSTEFVESAAKAAFADDGFGRSEIVQLNYELLYQVTHERRYLEDAIRQAGTRFMLLNLGTGFKKETRQERDEVILEALIAKPKTFEEYETIKQRLSSTMGKYWKKEFLERSDVLTKRVAALKLLIFVVSIVGLLLIWSGEAFGEAASSNEDARRPGA